MAGNPTGGALTNKIDHPRNVIMREEILLPPLDTWLAHEFGPRQRPHTVARLVDQAAIAAPIPAAVAPAGPTIAECDAKLARYRQALEAGADPSVVAGWIAETQAERRLAEQRDKQPATIAETGHRLSADEILAIVEELGDMVTALRDAEPEHKLDVYRNLGLRLTYNPGNTNGAGRYRSCHAPLGIGWCPRLDTDDMHTVIAARKLALSA